MNPQENIRAVEAARGAVREHCMCFDFQETPTHYRVIYPAGNFPDGVQASKEIGKAEALRRILTAMEHHWRANGIHGGA